jgi:hypothetical protein
MHRDKCFILGEQETKDNLELETKIFLLAFLLLFLLFKMKK